ncbi:MAG: S1/P1 nuclease [Acidobacteria bacterium]|nr:S1/P1 nuclease [Acidobacteriota bacterium]MBV9478787.1 S1/P1 nuclease [Acidobacteriota bacterium]
MNTHRRIAAIVVLLFAPRLALAWGNFGHQVIGELAQSRLNPKAGARVLALLQSDEDCPSKPVLRSMGDVASLPDDWRRPEGGEITSDWHFVNIDIANPKYVEARDCPSGDCVVRRIDRMMAVLRDKTRSTCEQKDALIYLIHFVGDIHQPLHTGFGHMANGDPDRGGNLVKVTLDGQETNLHSAWDTGLIRRQQCSLAEWLRHLRADVVPTLTAAQRNDLDAVHWANESHGEAIRAHVADKTTLRDTYIKTANAIIEKRLALAAVRLANVLDELLGK